jgi:phosphodiesterase/alkaline phosphatase D-like protein
MHQHRELRIPEREHVDMVHLRVGPLVRATSATSAVIWVEFSQACEITLRAEPHNATPENAALCITTRTVTVGTRHYAAPQLRGLQPATYYRYHLSIVANHRGTVEEAETERVQESSLSMQYFRTLDASTATPQNSYPKVPLRIAYGSCRKSEDSEIDALSAFGTWLLHHSEQRETMWPHVLLLIGDQIYADEPPPKLCQTYPQLRGGAKTFADFALLHEYAWTKDTGIRQVLATLPTYMIFDDHEVTNNWNTSPTWRAKVIENGMEQVLVDGLVAYWIYQGWGNLCERSESHPLITIIQQAEQSGEDALEALRACVKQEVYATATICWHYEIPTTPPIFVMNARADRSVVFSTDPQEIYAPTRIMSQSQMAQLHGWIQEQNPDLSILVSSVPMLLPPLIGIVEYLMGIRFWQRTPLRWLGLQLARLQQQVALKISFDHWPLYAATWREFVQLLREYTRRVLVLSGDVHFSYAAEAHIRHARSRIYQFVSTPFQNRLSRKDRRIVERQAIIKRASYGGMRTHVLPLTNTDGTKRVEGDLLFQNTLALVRVQPQKGDRYDIQQEYFGIVDGQMEVVARTILRRDEDGPAA